MNWISLEEFIRLTIVTIDKEIKEFNEQSKRVRAHMPEEIEFNIWVNEYGKLHETINESNGNNVRFTIKIGNHKT